MTEERVILMESAQNALRQHFLGWQCRLRQLSMREASGRPNDAMRPEVTPAGHDSALGAITVLIHKEDNQDLTTQFRFIYKRTQDPLLRLEDGLKILQAGHYQRAAEFSDVMTALFAPESKAAALLVHLGKARLDFRQFSQAYSIPCEVTLLGRDEGLWQATYWHNSLFNPQLPGDVKILAFKPDWAHASADPPLEG